MPFGLVPAPALRSSARLVCENNLNVAAPELRLAQGGIIDILKKTPLCPLDPLF